MSKGDLAIIIKSHAGNEGVFCEVLEAFDRDQYPRAAQYPGYDLVWMILPARSIPDSQGQLWSIGSIPDAWLRKVSGIPDADTTETEQDREIVA